MLEKELKPNAKNNAVLDGFRTFTDGQINRAAFAGKKANRKLSGFWSYCP
jgi:hypothetical protein